MSFPDFIARRYFFGKKRLFAAFLSTVAVAGVALGVFSLVVVMSVMTGFSRDLQQKLLGLSPHLTVEKKGADDKLLSDIVSGTVTGVDSYAIVVSGEGIIEPVVNGAVSAQGGKILGMDSSDLGKIKNVDLLVSSKEGCVLGAEMAVSLGVAPEYEDRIKLVSPIGRVGPTGELLPQSAVCPVGGIFRSGYFEHDSKTVIVPKKMALNLFPFQSNRELYIWLKDVSRAEELKREILKKDSSLSVRTWGESNKKLFAALKLERMAMTALLLLIVLTACVSIVSVVFMYIFSRRKDIAILSAIGAANGQIVKIFVKMGVYIGSIGALVGVLAGLGVLLYFKNAAVRLPAAYYLERLPVVISPFFLVIAAVCAVLMAVLCALYPALQAARLKPQELLRYE